MKRISVRFEADESLPEIQVIIRAPAKDEQVTALLDSLADRSPGQLMAMDENKCPCVIAESDIVFISSEGKQMRIVTKSGVYTVKQPLQNIEKLLGRQFLRISRFEIINLKMVRKYDFTMIGTLRIEFRNGMETWASRRYIPLIRKRLSEKEDYLC